MLLRSYITLTIILQTRRLRIGRKIKAIQTSKSGPLISHPLLSPLQHVEVTSEKALHPYVTQHAIRLSNYFEENIPEKSMTKGELQKADGVNSILLVWHLWLLLCLYIRLYLQQKNQYV